ncbi:adenylate cyclase [Poseidonocella pacifica]|uniref:Adenylate cyclase n=1 Tax=Poseidonocella pacifica TaxID=871651 RepID=A0A1I0XBI9_9RHOB|nr:adenylate/guanylate cyclase domain-containing protein [Poseidonocella pacifica]SFA98341.1 adenylate cyclase [Poseidonocella pacifica]
MKESKIDPVTPTAPRMDGNEELWRTIFADGHPTLERQHRLFGWLPSAPRCRLCRAPFAGPGGVLTRLRGRRPTPRNRNYCNSCDAFLEAFPGGANVELSLLFADIRNSTEYAQGADPSEVSTRVNRFLDGSTQIITENDGFVMAFYGDCVVAVWPPGYCGPDHAAKALAAGRSIAAHFTHDPDPVPVGIGVHRGDVYIGTVDAARGLFRDVSVFGLEVTVAARLSSVARAGEVLASTDIARGQPGLADAPRQSFDLKGVGRSVATVSIRE